MKKLLSLLAVSMLGLTACGTFEGTVVEKTEASFLLELPNEGPEAESDVVEIFLNDDTRFSGAISSFDELKEGQYVQVGTFDTPAEFDYDIASDVFAEED